jgi:DNA-binding SARP family transcriptional activator
MVWGEDQMEPGTGALRTLVWSVRKVLAPEERLRHDARGYRLEVHPGELDVDDFRHFAGIGSQGLDTGEYHAAALMLTEALRLWVEPSLTDVPRTPAMAAAVHKLEEERRAAHQALFTARLELGQHRDLLADLKADIEAHPQNERSWELLMLALYRCGRRADALEAYRRARSYLAENHGIEPGPCLRTMQRRILADDDALSP